MKKKLHFAAIFTLLLLGSTVCSAQLLDRTNWTIETSITGAKDVAVGGDNPLYIIDGETKNCFLFVKPGKTYAGVAAPADYVPSFTIDMQAAQEFNYFTYRHRTYNNTTANLRAKAVSLYGKSNAADDFELIVERAPIATDVAEVTINLAKAVTYRYVKLTIDEWNTSYSTIQVSEFNLGYENNLSVNDVSANEAGLFVHPNPVRAGSELFVAAPELFNHVKIYDSTGKLHKICNTTNISTQGLSPGLYVLQTKNTSTGKSKTAKFVVK